MLIDDDPIASESYQASNTITSTGVVASGSDVVFDAGQEVLLLPNFQSADNFHAFIEGCSPMFQAPNTQSAYREIQSYVEAFSKPTTKIETNIRNFPNPFSESTTFEIQLEEKTTVRLEVFDLSGRLVKTLINNELMDSGIHHVGLNANQMQSGIYVYKFSTEQESTAGKMILKKL